MRKLPFIAGLLISVVGCGNTDAPVDASSNADGSTDVSGGGGRDASATGGDTEDDSIGSDSKKDALDANSGGDASTDGRGDARIDGSGPADLSTSIDASDAMDSAGDADGITTVDQSANDAPDTPSDTGGAEAGAPTLSCNGSPGWSWNDRFPTADGTDVVALWGASTSDVWESRGVHGVIHNYNGAQWTDVPLGEGNIVKALYGTAANDVWAVGTSGLLAHFDGANWSCLPRMTTSNLNDVWASGPNDVWVGGDGESGPGLGTAVKSVVLHWNGSTWSRIAPLPWEASGCEILRVTRVWSTAPNDGWALVDRHCSGNLGNHSAVARWNGSTWESMLDSYCDNTMPCYTAGWASSPNNAVVLTLTPGGTPSGGFVAWNGSSWGNSSDTTLFSGIWGAAANDFWLASQTGAQHWNGSAFQSDPVTGAHVTGSSSNNVWIYGLAGSRHHWQGSSFSDFSTTLTPETRVDGLKTIWGSGSDAVWAIATPSGKVLRRRGSGWSETGSPAAIVGIGGSGPNNLWAVDGISDLVHFYNGTSWSQASSGVGVPLNAVWAASANDVWVVGNSAADSSGPVVRYYKTTVHWNGSTWTKVAVEAPGAGAGSAVKLTNVVGNASTDVWAVGDDGARLYWDGQSWSETAGSVSTTKLWVGGTNDVWFYSGNSYAHWNGSTWIPGSWSYVVTTLTGPSSTDWWYADDYGAIQRFDGLTASKQYTGFDPAVAFTTIWATATDVYAGSTTGISVHLTR